MTKQHYINNHVSSTADLTIAVPFISNLLRIISLFSIVNGNSIVILKAEAQLSKE